MKMNLLKLSALVLAFFAYPVVYAQPSTLPVYPESTIREWQPEFRQMVQDNYRNLFRPQLTAELQRLTVGAMFPFASATQNTIMQLTRKALEPADLRRRTKLVHEGRFGCTCAHYSS